MSLLTTALIGDTELADILEVQGCLNASSDLGSEWFADPNDCDSIDGPNGYYCRRTPRGLIFYSVMSFVDVFTDQQLTDSFLRQCRRAAVAIGARTLIVAPTIDPWEDVFDLSSAGKSVSEIRSYLRKFGPPVPHPAMLVTQRRIDVAGNVGTECRLDGYYVETAPFNYL